MPVPRKTKKETFEIKVEGRVNLMLLICEAYKRNVLSKEEITQLIVEFFFQL